MPKIKAYGAVNEKSPLDPIDIERRDVRDRDVKIDILYCGVCHSDLHQVRNEWKNSVYPLIPGHEIVGRVVEVGKGVKKYMIGDLVAVGCLVDSCRTCENCQENLEQFCDTPVFTYNGKDKTDGSSTYGGYSTQIVVDDSFVLKIPSGFSENDLPGVAPLLCAGITTYSPLKHFGVKPGSRVGIVGLGGLGHMAIKIAAAMKAHVIVFTSSKSKVEDAKRLGAHEVILSSDVEAKMKLISSLDLIVDTASVPHNLDEYVQLLKRDGSLCLLGVPETPHPSPNVMNLIFKRRQIAGSLIGGIKETQEMLDFCAAHHILSDIEMIPIQKINEAYERLLKSDVKYRFVIDIQTLKNS